MVLSMEALRVDRMRSDLTDSRGGVRNFLMEAGGGVGRGPDLGLENTEFFSARLLPPRLIHAR